MTLQNVFNVSKVKALSMQKPQSRVLCQSDTVVIQHLNFIVDKSGDHFNYK